MLNLTFNPLTGKLTLVSPVPLKATSNVPVTVTFTSAPSSVTGLSVALGSGQTPQRTLAFIDVFSGSGSVYTATLNANDTRMQAFMTGRGAAVLDIELAGIINGFLWIVHNVKVTVEAGVVTGPETTQGGPVYYTGGQVDAAIAAAVGAGAWQPLDSDLTAIAGLSTTSFGRSFLTRADAAAGRTLIGSVIGTDVQAYSATLAALVGNTVATLNFSNVTAALAEARFAIASGTQPRLSTGHGSGGAALELGQIATLTEGNAGFLQNLAIDGYSSQTFRTYQGYEVGSIGYDNPSASVFPGCLLFEASDAFNAFGGLAPRLVLSQYTNFTGSGAAGHNPRLTLETDGTINFYPQGTFNAGAPYVVFHKSSPIYLFGYAGEISLAAPAGVAIITVNGSKPQVGGGGTLWLRAIEGGNDDTSSIQIRLSDGHSTRHSAYGGTLASGGGHQFFTGGLYGSQALRLLISNDGVQSFVPLLGTYLSATGDGTAAGFAGFTASSSVLKLANSGAEIDLMVSSSSALGGTAAAVFTATQVTFPGDVRIGTLGPRWRYGTATPEAAVTGGIGSFFCRTDGGSGTSFYVKESGTGNTGWVTVFTGSQTIGVANGGLGVATLTAYAPIFGGTTGTGAVQSGTVGTAGQALTSNGPGALPTFQTPASGYTLTIVGPPGASPADSLTYYMGQDLTGGLNTVYASARMEIPKAGVITRVSLHVHVATVLGTSETVNHFIRLNDTTDVAAINTAYDAADREGVATAVNQAVIAGDFIALKIATPAWATNPTGVRWSAIVYIAT